MNFKVTEIKRTIGGKKVTRYRVYMGYWFNQNKFESQYTIKNDMNEFFTSQKEAKDWYKNFIKNVKQNINKKNAKHTFDIAIDLYFGRNLTDNLSSQNCLFKEYIQDMKGTENHYQNEKQNAIKWFKKIEVQKKPLIRIENREIVSNVKLSSLNENLIDTSIREQFRNLVKVNNKPLSKITKQRMYRHFQLIMAQAKRHQLIDYMPHMEPLFYGGKKEKKNLSNIEPINKKVFEQLRRDFPIYTKIIKKIYPKLYAPFMVSSLMGLRRGETAALYPSQFNFDNDWCLVDSALKTSIIEKNKKAIYRGTVKNDISREVPCDNIKDILSQHIKLFCWSEGKKLNLHSNDFIFDDSWTSEYIDGNWLWSWYQVQFYRHGFWLKTKGSKTTFYIWKIKGTENYDDLKGLEFEKADIIFKDQQTNVISDQVIPRKRASFLTDQIASHYDYLKIPYLFDWHDLRHFAASLWFNVNLPLEEISDYLGHTSTSTTRSYYIEWLSKKDQGTGVSKAMEALGMDSINLITKHEVKQLL